MEEHHAPERIEPKGLGDYLEVMSKAVFFSGMNWGVVEKKWPTTQEAFHGFDPEIVAGLTVPPVALRDLPCSLNANRKSCRCQLADAVTSV